MKKKNHILELHSRKSIASEKELPYGQNLMSQILLLGCCAENQTAS